MREQVIANINSLEQQGAKPEEIQGWLDSLKSHATTTPETQIGSGTQQGFFQRIAKDYLQAGQNIVGDIARAGSADPGRDPYGAIRTTAEAGLRTAGNVASAVFAPVTEGIKSIGDFTGLSGSSDRPFVGGLVGDALQKYSDWAQKHPEAAKDLEASVNIAASLGGEKAIQGAKSVAKGTFLDAKRALAKRGSVLKDVLETTMPKLSSAEEAAAKAEGRVATRGILKKVSIEPSKSELDMARYAREAGVRSVNTFDKNISVMRQAQKASANLLRQGLRASKAIWNKNEFKGILGKIEEPITVKSDLTLSNQAGHLKNAVMKLVDIADKNPTGILDVRQQFDQLVEKQFGSKIFAKNDPFGNLVRSYRQAMNDFAESKIPNGSLPGGKTFKGELRRQSLLYNAIDNVAETSPRIGQSGRPFVGKALNFVRKHPIVSGAAAFGVEKAAKNLGLPFLP